MNAAPAGGIEVVRHARARRMRLAVDPRDGTVRLTLPPRASLKKGLAWAEEHRGWIDAQQARLPQGRPFAPGALIPFRGQDVQIVWRADGPRKPTLDDGQLVCSGAIESLPGRIARWLRAEALRILTAETLECAGRAGVEVIRVSVGDARGRWGSCASSGAIRYSWRLVLAPDFVRQATVAHEVAHRVHMNHSPAFHRLAAALYAGDPGPARAWLRRHGSSLHWVGR